MSNPQQIIAICGWHFVACDRGFALDGITTAEVATHDDSSTVGNTHFESIRGANVQSEASRSLQDDAWREPSQYFHPLWFAVDSAIGQLIGLSEPSRGLVVFTRGQSPTQLQRPESAAAPHIAGSGTPDATPPSRTTSSGNVSCDLSQRLSNPQGKGSREARLSFKFSSPKIWSR